MNNKENNSIELKKATDGLGVTLQAMFDGVKALAGTNTVLGEPMQVGSTFLIPVMEITSGMVTGEFGENAARKNAGAVSSRISPVAILVMEGDHFRLITVKNQDVVTKVGELIPEVIDRLAGKFNVSEKAVKEAENAAAQLKPQTVSEN